jgi:hypothetical protein
MNIEPPKGATPAVSFATSDVRKTFSLMDKASNGDKQLSLTEMQAFKQQSQALVSQLTKALTFADKLGPSMSWLAAPLKRQVSQLEAQLKQVALLEDNFKTIAAKDGKPDSLSIQDIDRLSAVDGDAKTISTADLKPETPATPILSGAKAVYPSLLKNAAGQELTFSKPGKLNLLQTGDLQVSSELVPGMGGFLTQRNLAFKAGNTLLEVTTLNELLVNGVKAPTQAGVPYTLANGWNVETFGKIMNITTPEPYEYNFAISQSQIASSLEATIKPEGLKAGGTKAQGLYADLLDLDQNGSTALTKPLDQYYL